MNPRLPRFLPLLKKGRLLDLAGGMGKNASLFEGWSIVLTDISEEALMRASPDIRRVQANALALPFPPNTFDTLVDTYFFEPGLDLAELLTPGGTLFFETFTVGEGKYRAEHKHSPRLDPAEIGTVFRGLEILSFEETDDGERVWGTLLARKPG